ncbi:unnamed protein product [Ectocarpus sp. 12 AP-2014]
MRTPQRIILGVLLTGLGLAVTEETTDSGQCTYQFRANRTLFALETTTLVDFHGVVLAPGHVLAAYFTDIPYPNGGANITGASLFVIPTFRTSSSTLLEAAVAIGQGNTTSTMDSDGAGSAGASPKDSDDVPRNASLLESQGTVNGWSLSDTQSSEGRSLEWEACRYYEVGNIREGVETVISHPALANVSKDVEVFVRHHSGPNAFIEGNSDTYANHIVLQIRSDCGWNLNTGESSNKFDESPENNQPRDRAWTNSPSSSGNSYWDYTSDAGVESGYSRNYYSGGTSALKAAGPIENGRRHALCGGEYLDNCDLGPYRPSDVGDGSCQQHLNTEGCHYDGGECSCCSASCEWASTSGTPYTCHGPELDPYFCIDPEYAVDVAYELQDAKSAATRTLPLTRFYGVHKARARLGDCSVGILASLTVVMTIVVAAVNIVTLL